jgi:hypothetical protein
VTFTVEKVAPFQVGGLVVPGVEPGAFSGDGDLVRFTLERLRNRGVRNPTIVFVRDPEVGWSAVVGYRCAGLEDLAVGDSLIRVSEKHAARFTHDRGSPDTCEDLWRQVEVAEKTGQITRAYSEEVLDIPDTGETALYISLA